MAKLPTLALASILAGFLLILVSIIISVLKYPANFEVSGAFVITIFFIPIAGFFGKYGEILLILLVALTIILIIVQVFLALRARRSAF